MTNVQHLDRIARIVNIAPNTIPTNEALESIAALRASIVEMVREDAEEQSELDKLSDAEVICEFMEPRRPWEGPWWKIRGPWDDVATPDNSRHVPRTLTLNECHEVEGWLTDEQWRAYRNAILRGADMMGPWMVRLIHATAEQKTAALASVLRTTDTPK